MINTSRIFTYLKHFNKTNDLFSLHFIQLIQMLVKGVRALKLGIKMTWMQPDEQRLKGTLQMQQLRLLWGMVGMEKMEGTEEMVLAMGLVVKLMETKVMETAKIGTS